MSERDDLGDVETSSLIEALVSMAVVVLPEPDYDTDRYGHPSFGIVHNDLRDRRDAIRDEINRRMPKRK